MHCLYNIHVLYYSFLAVDHMFPEFDIWSDFLVSYRNNALHLDSLENSHPIQVPVMHPAQVVIYVYHPIQVPVMHPAQVVIYVYHPIQV